MPDLDPAVNFLIGETAHEAENVLVLGSLSGVQENDRSIENGQKLFKIWKTQPEVTPVRGKGGGLKTDRGGWLGDKIDEIFLLTSYGLTVLTLYDQHHVVAAINRRAQSLGVDAMYEIKWRLTKKKATFADGEYPKYEPDFEVLGVKDQPTGPTDAEIAQAKKLHAMVAQLSYPYPDVPLRLVVGGPPTEGPPPPPPPPTSIDDYGDPPF